MGPLSDTEFNRLTQQRDEEAARSGGASEASRSLQDFDDGVARLSLTDRQAMGLTVPSHCHSGTVTVTGTSRTWTWTCRESPQAALSLKLEPRTAQWHWQTEWTCQWPRRSGRSAPRCGSESWTCVESQWAHGDWQTETQSVTDCQ